MYITCRMIAVCDGGVISPRAAVSDDFEVVEVMVVECCSSGPFIQCSTSHTKKRCMRWSVERNMMASPCWCSHSLVVFDVNVLVEQGVWFVLLSAPAHSAVKGTRRLHNVNQYSHTLSYAGRCYVAAAVPDGCHTVLSTLQWEIVEYSICRSTVEQGCCGGTFWNTDFSVVRQSRMLNLRCTSTL